MPINRTNFNLLVDDDGSNLVGTVWDKAHIKDVILDPVDAALVTDLGAWQNIAYVAADFTASPSGGWNTSAPAAYAYSLSGKTMILTVYATTWGIVGAPLYLQIKIPGGMTAARQTGGSYVGMQGGAAMTGYWLTTSNNIQLARDQLGTPWTTGAMYVHGTFIINVA